MATRPKRAPITVTVMLALAVLIAACGGAGPDRGQGPDPQAPFSTAEWSTDFATASVPLTEFVSGGPPKDGIPSIDDPRFVGVAEADGFLSDSEPVALLELGGERRAYPLQILIWHEIVNDEVAGNPIAVTFCPLCNSTVAFSRELDGEVLEFGTTGKLRNSDLVMFDRQTESWWQQITTEAIVGELTGSQLEILPSQIVSWGEFKRIAPEGSVLSRETGFDRDYGANPYSGYDDVDSSPFLFDGETDERLPPKERVTAVQTDSGSAVVYPFSRLEKEPALADQVDGEPVVVLFDPDVGSALDAAEIADSRMAGAGGVFSRRVEGRTLSFEPTSEPGRFQDSQTGSLWDASGNALEGRLAGRQLRPIPSDDQFWFALAAFYPEAEIRGG